MSQENVEIVRSIYAAWERGDFGSVAWAHPDIEYVITDGPTPGRWTGHAGLREGFHHFAGAWDKLHVRATEYRQLDDERVLVLTRLSGRGKRSGLDLEQMQGGGADVLHVRGGKVTRFALYHDRERALSNLGLSE
jgi:ketosteroid isomerase-like protein